MTQNNFQESGVNNDLAVKMCACGYMSVRFPWALANRPRSEFYLVRSDVERIDKYMYVQICGNNKRNNISSV